MPEAESWTIGRLLTWTTDYLKRSGAESPRLDAELLLAHARGCKRIDLYTAFEEAAGEPLRTAFRELVKRRADGMPVAYLVGRREFYSLSFRVTPDVLIPRPETEFVVVETLDLIARAGITGRPVDVADVGTGSGAIAVCLAKHAPAARVTAIDISPAALKIATQNVADHALAERITLVESDLLTALPPDARFDFIVSNPPYIGQSEMPKLAREVRDHEPHLALVGGEVGVEVIQRLIPQAAERLRPGGWLVLEISPFIEPQVRQLFADDARWETPVVTKDLAQLARVVKARRRAAA